MTKICTKCGKEKDKSKFYKQLDSTTTRCKLCINEKRKNYHHSKEGLVSTIYSSQRTHSRRREQQLPSYDLEELREWCYSQELFHTLYDNWKRLDYQKDYTPSIDRQNNKLGYTIGNIQLMTWRANLIKEKSVWVQNLNTGEVFDSMTRAAHSIGVSKANSITKAIQNNRPIKGYKWRYVDVS